MVSLEKIDEKGARISPGVLKKCPVCNSTKIKKYKHYVCLKCGYIHKEQNEY